jgi:hypothetical protein
MRCSFFLELVGINRKNYHSRPAMSTIPSLRFLPFLPAAGRAIFAPLLGRQRLDRRASRIYSADIPLSGTYL